jgi:GNAT superfamily N-acetyltransferase
MKITLREDHNPDIDFYYHKQFEIYHEPYLIWDRETWEEIIISCNIYRIEVGGKYGGDVILEDRGWATKYIVDFSVLPEYQGKGIGRAALEKVKRVNQKLKAITRKETLGFFLKCGFVIKRTIRNYYQPGINGYYITLGGSGVIDKKVGTPNCTCR